MDQQDLSSTAPSTKVLFNGSRWHGQDPAGIDELLDVLSTEPLCRSFEDCGNFVIDKGDGVTRFWGNFHTVSHVFCVDTSDPVLVARLTAAVRANQQTAAYQASLPPRCRNCIWTATGRIDLACGEHEARKDPA
jgi:hypothetical protein